MRKFFKDQAKESLKGRWLLIIGVTLIHFLLTGWTSVNSIIELRTGENYFLLFSIPSLLIGCFLSVGLAKFHLEFANPNGEPKIQLLFSFFKIYFKTLGLALLTTIVIFLGFLLLIVPGIIASFALSQCSYILAEDPEISIIDCMKKSMQLMKGRKFDYFVLQLSFIGWGLLSILTLGIGFLFLIPYQNMTFTYFYINAKENSFL